MISRQEILIRNKITGVLLRNARLQTGKSVDACAAALSTDPAFIVGAEEGRESLTLPQLESLARVLQVPIQYLLGEQDLLADLGAPEPLRLGNVMALRQKIIGVILQQARLEAGWTLDEVAAVLDCGPERIVRIEFGQEPIGLAELQALAQALDLSFEELVTEDTTLPAEGERSISDAQQLAHLPPEILDFVLKPLNVPYLQAAMNLSQMPVDALRQFAAGLFEITY
jgi:transcriptional regulator with XRE-family HTH domain